VRHIGGFGQSFIESAFKMVENMTPQQMRDQAKLIGSDNPPGPLSMLPAAQRQQMAAQLTMFADNPELLKTVLNQAKNADPDTLKKAYDAIMPGTNKPN